MFKAKSYYNMQYHFRSIDTWLQGVCKSFCAQHAWRKSKFLPGHKSVFALLVESDASSEEGDEPPQDEAASDDEGWGPAEGEYAVHNTGRFHLDHVPPTTNHNQKKQAKSNVFTKGKRGSRSMYLE